MNHATTEPMTFPTTDSNAAEAAGPPPADPLTEVLRAGARQLLTQAVEAEVEQWIADHAHLTDENGHRQVVRNGYAQPRQVVTGLGPIDVRAPRVHDRRDEPQRERFTSAILPPCLRTKNPIESMFATVRLRTDKTMGCGSRIAPLRMVFKLAQSAQANWRRLNGNTLLSDAIAGIALKDAEKQAA